MELNECIKKRRSIRKFSGRTVGIDQIYQILEAGIQSPTAGNAQDWRFVIVKDKKKKEQLAKAALKQYFITKAPYLIVVCSDTYKIKKVYRKRGDLYAVQDTAAAIMTMLLKITDLGLASCWIGAFNENEVSRVLRLPEEVRPLAILPIGHSTEKAISKKRILALEKITFFEEYGNKKLKTTFPLIKKRK